jgi:predicted nucleotidyltransferase
MPFTAKKRFCIAWIKVNGVHFMRLTIQQALLVKKTVNTILNAPSNIWLFGSRVNDEKRGGDIDLFIETQSLCPNRAETICCLYGELVMTLGEQKIDILLKDKNTAEAPIFEMARQNGVLL